jgi:hypothetical protein
LSEHQHQVAYFTWAARSGLTALDALHSVPNGAGRKTRSNVLWAAAEGLKAGQPDVELPVARGGFLGLAIEFKFDKNNCSAEQIRRLTLYQKNGWLAVVCWDWEAAKRVTEGYLMMLRCEMPQA